MGESAIKERINACSGWLVQKQLGRGQYGTAYLVEGTNGKSDDEDESGKPKGSGTRARQGDFAVAKVVGLEFLPEKEHEVAFQEVKLMRSLRHNHIVSLRDHFFTEANLELVIVMEYCDQGDLRGEVKKRSQAKPVDRIPEAQLMVWFVQLTLALNYIHQRHVLHRDLKSSNIFMTTSEDKSGLDVKIGDFGISRVLEGTVDVAATVVGTPYYMSPEVCKAEPYGYKSDIWALGCVLYEMCMLKHAFESQSLLGLVYKIVSENYDPIPSQYSAELRSLMERVLDKSHYTRPSGKDLLADPFVKRFVPGKHSDAAAAPVNSSDTTAADSEKEAAAAATKAKTEPLPKSLAQQLPARATLGARATKVQTGQRVTPSLGGMMRMPEASPPAPDVAKPVGAAVGSSCDEPGQRRQWHAPNAAPSKQLDEAELRGQVLLGRIRRALAVRRQNWLQVFASFDHVGDGRLPEAEFERAVTSMGLGLSDEEIREVRRNLQRQSGSDCVPVDLFGKALHSNNPEVLRAEAWGRSKLADLTREASKAAGGGSPIATGAAVRIQGLQNAVSLNGCEGIVDHWDASSCRWVVKIGANQLKAIRDENIQVMRPAPSSAASGAGDSTALCRELCEGGETAVPEEKFFAVVDKLLPNLSQPDHRKLLLLLPKSSDGRIDVPEVMAHFLAGPMADGTVNLGGPLFAGSSPAGTVRDVAPGPDWRPGQASSPSRQPTFQRPAPPQRKPVTPGPGPPGRGPLPNSVPSPRSSPASPSRERGFGRGGPSNALPQPNRLHAEVWLLRLAQRLLSPRNAGKVEGPGVDVLRLFAARPDELRLDSLLDAVSVLPLGISRAEVQGVFAHLSGDSELLPLATLGAACEAAYKAGAPAEAAALDGLNVARLAAALQRLDSAGGGSGRASPQEFRVTLMQAEPYLTSSQLEWLMVLTDKDGEGRLLPRSLITRLGAGSTAPPRGGALLVPPRPAAASRTPVAPHTPRSLVVAAVLARIRDRLFAAGPLLTLERILSLFEIAADRGTTTSRETLACLLGHLRLGISVAEADELVSSLAGGSAVGSASGSVQIAGLFDAINRAGDPESEAVVDKLREAARERLLGRGTALVAAIGYIDGGDFLSELDFRRCLTAAMADEGVQVTAPEGDEEDRLVLLADKNAAGSVRWRPFAQIYAGVFDDEYVSDCGSPHSPKKGSAPPTLRTDGAGTTQQTWHQTWRSGKTAPERTVVAFSPDKMPATEPLRETTTPPPQGCCRCFSRMLAS
mmetsp:Transcript_49388/g.89391  ORF Transcript_49388/g.89391 Transcript_49388/m.89391 type:complete len:1256 (+) Transcript_49388:108-3875(+)